MNERIKLISDTEVEVQRNCAPTCITKFRIFTTDVNYIRVVSMTEGDGNWDYDELGNDAELEVRQCWKDTGSFAALSDKSAVLFIGKKVRIRGRVGEWTCRMKTVGHGDTCNLLQYDHGGESDWTWCKDDELLPLTDPTPPPKKYRPLTPVEALHNFGRKIISDNDEVYYLYSVYPDGVYWDSFRMTGFETLVERFRFADTGNPCGVEEA